MAEDTVQHTPGPWEVHPQFKCDIYADTGRPDRKAHQIAFTNPSFVPGGKPVAEANARLIAAAPEVLTMLSRFCRKFEESGRPWTDDVVYRESLAVIAKAVPQ